MTSAQTPGRMAAWLPVALKQHPTYRLEQASEQWPANTTQTITWKTAGDTQYIKNIDLEYIVGSDVRPLTGKMKASSEKTTQFAADHLNDDDLQTRWEAEANHLSNNWIEIDFGKSQTFNEVRLTEVGMLGNHFSQGEIQYWNGSRWIEAARFTDTKTVKVIKFAPVTGSKARLLIPRATGNISLSELGFYSYAKHTIAHIPNTGSYSWNLPKNLPTDIQLQIRSHYSYTRSGNIKITQVSKIRSGGQ